MVLLKGTGDISHYSGTLLSPVLKNLLPFETDEASASSTCHAKLHRLTI